MTHRVEKGSAFPTKYYMSFPQVVLFIPQSSVTASSTTVKINKFDFFGLTCHIFCCCFFKSILNSPTDCVQTEVFNLPWKRRRRKAHTFSLLCSAPSLDNTGRSQPQLVVPQGRNLSSCHRGTAQLACTNAAPWPCKLSSAFTSAEICFPSKMPTNSGLIREDDQNETHGHHKTLGGLLPQLHLTLLDLVILLQNPSMKCFCLRDLSSGQAHPKKQDFLLT